jgi:AcrR family transcriptional regulator
MTGVPSRLPGRPRQAAIDARITDATIALLGEVGYQALSLAAVAARAQVGRPALYRRYRSKPELVVAAIAALSTAPTTSPPLPDDAREALGILMRATAAALARPGAATILGSLLAQERRDPELVATFRERFFEPRRSTVREVLRRGVDSGALRADLDLDVADAALFGGLLAPLVLGDPLDDAWVDRILEGLWPTLRKDAA